MRFFVTGANGFVGSHLVRELEERGHDVVLMHRPGAQLGGLAGRRARRVEGSLHSTDDLARAMEGADGVFHVAGNTSWFRGDTAEVRRANLDTTRAVVVAMKQAGVRRGVLTSSVSAVGVSDDPARPADEDTVPNWPDGFGYPRSKREAEDVAFSADGVEMVAVNPATVFGPGDERMGIGVVFQKIAARKFPRLRQGGFSACDVRDVAKGHLLAFEKGRPGRRYILGGANVAYETVIETIAGALGVRPPGAAVPPWIIGLVHRVASLVERIGGRLDTAAAFLWCMTRYLYHSTERARHELGYAPRPFEETVADSIAWYRQAGRLA